MRELLSFYHPKLPIRLVYMLQQVEYDPSSFLRWIARLPRLNRIMHRQQLVWTGKAKLLIIFMYCAGASYTAGSVAVLLIEPYLGLTFLLLMPFLIILLLYILVLMAWLFIERPRRKHLIEQSEKSFARHPAIKIAIAGSYGKTTIKELLETVLSEGRKVTATPGNRNVLTSHARWINTLDGDEDVLIIEYGEGAPGDIEYFAKITHPTMGIITGLAPNHLDHYKTLQAVTSDLFSLAEYVKEENIYANSESKDLLATGNISIRPFHLYDQNGVANVAIHNAKVAVTGMNFQASITGGPTIEFETKLVGRHLLGPLALCIELANGLGLSAEQIKRGISLAEPFEHRMQPRPMHGAWIIDDTYNGNLEGVRAGLKLLAELPAQRKIYVTPGLVDQGAETEKIHNEIGRLISEVKPDQVVLMQNSVTDFIKKGLMEAGFEGKLLIESDPLEFYTNLEHIVAAGDLVLMQNDWTDNYR